MTRPTNKARVLSAARINCMPFKMTRDSRAAPPHPHILKLPQVIPNTVSISLRAQIEQLQGLHTGNARFVPSIIGTCRYYYRSISSRSSLLVERLSVL